MSFKRLKGGGMVRQVPIGEGKTPNAQLNGLLLLGSGGYCGLGDISWRVINPAMKAAEFR
jgi:hypothetical protein